MKEAGSYDDIIHMERPVSRNHRPMTRLARAAQFSPFAALTELEGTMAETARLTEPRRAADESRLAALNEKTGILAAHAAERPWVRLRCFVPDGRKQGGAYETVVGRVRRVDVCQRLLLMTDGRQIPLDDIDEMALTDGE